MHYAKKNENWGICNELIDYFNEIDSRDSEVLSRQARLYIFRDKKEKTEVYDHIKSKRIEAKQFEFDYDSILLDTASEFSDYDYALDFCKKEYEYNSLRCVLRKIKYLFQKMDSFQTGKYCSLQTLFSHHAILLEDYQEWRQ